MSWRVLVARLYLSALFVAMLAAICLVEPIGVMFLIGSTVLCSVLFVGAVCWALVTSLEWTWKNLWEED